MAASSRRRLKVFQTQIGFYDTVVAAPSQAAALRAWGIHQNLFADRRASLADNPQAIEAALAHPEMPLRRAVGSRDSFELEPTSLPRAPAARRKAAKIAVASKAAPPERPAPDRSDLEAAERALLKVDKDRKQEEAASRQEREELDAKLSRAQDAYVQRRKAATGALVAAREAFRRAGGRD